MSVIAIIPARGGSQSIPLKNIKEFCGKPLIYWTLLACQECEAIDKIVLSTDHELIAETGLSFGFNKLEIHQRSEINSSNEASTESVLLEVIEDTECVLNDVVLLVQATSPLTTSIHLEEAITQYENTEVDSLLSCVNTKRFFWNDSEPINYDFKSRPRRQDFDGYNMENGALYINLIFNIMSYKNRLSGKIGIYLMPDYTALEIDEPIDWLIGESLLKHYVIGSK